MKNNKTNNFNIIKNSQEVILNKILKDYELKINEIEKSTCFI